jgi:predicted DNA-binding transcriptional regulator AlpA
LTAPNKKTRKLLSRKEVLERVPVSYPTLWKYMQVGKFPRSHEFGGKAFWFEAEIDKWMTTLPVVRLKGDAT